MQRYRPVSDIHSELWPENFYRAGKAIDRLVPPLADDGDTVLLLAGDIGSYRRRNVYKAVIERLCDRFRAVVDVPGNHFWYGGTSIEIETPPATRANYVFGSTARAFNVVAATLWADFWGDPAVEQHCAEGMNDFRQIPGLTVEAVRERHTAQLQYLRDNDGIEAEGL